VRHVFRYAIEGPAQAGRVAELSAADGRHLTRVVRRDIGDVVEIVDGDGRIWPATVADAGPPVRVRVGEAPRPAPPAPPIDLFVGVAARGRLDMVVEKATELGVRSVTLVSFERSRRGGPDPAGRRERLERVVDAAVRQSGQARRPDIRGLVPFPDVIGAIPIGTGFLVDAAGTRGLGDALRAVGPSSAAIVVGPEAGLAPSEVEAASAAGVRVCRLSTATLRAETAALAAAAVAADWFAGTG
jgi:16S rRNA (uracil1498-N3)-methyltransferase